MDHRTQYEAEVAVDEIELSELTRALRKEWKLLAATTLAAIFISILYLHLAPIRYAISLQVTAANNRGTGLSSELGDLASLAGLSLPASAEETPFELYLHGLTSRQTADLLARDGALMQRVFAREWDTQRSRWIEPTGLVVTLKRAVKVALGIPSKPWAPPDGARLQERLIKEIRIDRKKTSPIVTISVRESNIELGRDLLWKLHSQSDSILRERTLARTREYVDYLLKQLRTVDVAEYRQTLFDIISEQEKTRMVASSTLPYAGEPFGRPTASPRPVEPNVILVLAIGLLAGFAVGMCVALIRYFNGGRAR